MSARLLALTPGTLRLKRPKDERAQRHRSENGGKVIFSCRVSGNEVMYPGTRQ